MKIYVTLAIIFSGYGSLYSQAHKNDSSWLFNPEKHFWFSNSQPHILFNRAVAEQNHVVWGTAFHTAAPVPIGAIGPKEYTSRLKGIIQNTTIAQVIKQAITDKKNVILVIGDGMGTVHMTLPVYTNVAQGTKTETMFEKIMREGESGLVLTNTVSGMVTCSAAAGTALATGTKTRVNMVGVDSVGKPLVSSADLASKLGFKTAIVTDASVTDATPAAFYGHVVNRDDEEKLAFQLTQKKTIDVILGGGANLFIANNKSSKNIEEFQNFPGDYNQFTGRSDTLNLIDGFQKSGYTFACSKQEMDQAPLNKKLFGLFAANGMPSPISRNVTNINIPTVSQMAGKALEIISQSNNGYFAVIECAQIDWEAHANDIGGVYRAVLEMNEILKVAYLYYQKDPSNTLLMFTADHETGGLSIAYTKMEKGKTESYTTPNGEIWQNNTDPLYFKNFLLLEKQKINVGQILGMSNSANEFKENVTKYTGYIISQYEAEEIFKSYQELHGNVKMKK